MTSTTIATSGRSSCATVRAPIEPISSCTAATPATGPAAPPASLTRRATSSATYEPSRLSSERDTSRPLRSSTGSAAITSGSPTRTSERASSPSMAPTSTCRSLSLTAVSRSLPSSTCAGLRPDDARDRTGGRQHLDPLADQDLRVPAARVDQVQVALVVDVVDEQGDLVDVADDRHQRAVALAGHARDRAAELVGGDLGAEALGGFAPGGDGRRLGAGRSRRGDQRAQDVGQWGHGCSSSSGSTAIGVWRLRAMLQCSCAVPTSRRTRCSSAAAPSTIRGRSVI